MQLQTNFEFNKLKPLKFETLHTNQMIENTMEINYNIDNFLNKQHVKTDKRLDQFNFKFKELLVSKNKLKLNNKKKVMHFKM